MIRLFLPLRLIAVICGIFSLIIIGAVLLGSLLPTTVMIGYYKVRESIYVEYIEDVRREFRLTLTDPRCFSAYVRVQYYLALYDAGGDAAVPTMPYNRENMSVIEALALFHC